MNPNLIMKQVQKFPKKSRPPTAGVFFSVAIFGLLLALASFLIVRLKTVTPQRQSVLPPEKQAIQDRYDQERRYGFEHAANKDEIPTPLPVTPAPYPTGIFEETQPPYSTADLSLHLHLI